MPNYRVKGTIQITVTVNETVENVRNGVHAKDVVLNELISYPNVEVDNQQLLITKVEAKNDA